VAVDSVEFSAPDRDLLDRLNLLAPDGGEAFGVLENNVFL
jgi:hypothetical protein